MASGADRRAGDRTIERIEVTAMTPGATSRALIQVFAKAPVPGEVKTRLIPVLGADGATELYCRLARHTLATAALARVGPTEVWTTAPGESAFIQTCKRVLGVNVHLQPDADLGARMAAAAAAGLQRAGSVLIVGTDCPAMTFDDLQRARDALADGYDAVLGPAEDGGYWLVGLSRVDARLFEGIAWSTPTVLDATRDRLRALGWHWRELATRWDVDRPEDLTRLAAEPALSDLAANLTASPAPV
jgi:rSAM/selenodomain-associated transferase 1